jgi:Zn-dependent peptidase ImmA (M78 family)
MLILARESRGLTQAGLSRQSGVVQSAISKYENGMLEMSDDNLTEIANVLHYPKSLFGRSNSDPGFRTPWLHHRKRKSITMRDLKRIQATICLMSMQIGRLLRSAEIETCYEFPTFDISEHDENPEFIAGLVRRAWRLPSGPIRNLVAVIEGSGAIVVPLNLGTPKLDAVSLWPADMPPLLFINMGMPWERIIFSLAHEVGHLVMHQIPSLEQEAEANAFAAALLMPSQDIRDDLSGITIPIAAQLKPYWRVSMAALIYRAHTLKRITLSQNRRLFTDMSRHGYRKNEPNRLSPEKPNTLSGLIRVHVVDHQYSTSDLCKLLDLHEDDFEVSYRPRTVGPITMVK